MKSYEEFDVELKQVSATPSFHIVTSICKKNALALKDSLDEEYLYFLKRYGICSLYKNFEFGVYQLFVGLPIQHADGFTEIGSDLEGYPIGYNKNTHSNQILRNKGTGFQVLAYSFNEWFFSSCCMLKATISEEKWNSLITGCAPFSEKEKLIIRERRKFTLVSVEPCDSNLYSKLKIRNNSKIALPYLTLTVSLPHEGRGEVTVETGHIKPGETREVEVHNFGYNTSQVDFLVEDLAFNPEDRSNYWEFKRRN